jgi:predicted esterase
MNKMSGRQTPVISAVLVFTGFCLFGGCATPTAPQAEQPADLTIGLDAVAKEIVPWIEDEAPFLVSPDARQLLIKTDLEGGHSELRLEDIENRKVLGRYDGGWPLLIGWRPHSTAISFVEDDRGNLQFRLKLWTPADGKVVVPDVPTMATASTFMRWSPDGHYLALRLPQPTGPDQLRLFDAQIPSAKSTSIFEAEGIADYRWSADGSRLAVVAKGTGGNVVLIDQRDQRRRHIMISPGATLKQVAWMSNGRQLLVSCREPNRTEFALKAVDLESETSRTVAAADGDVDLPAAAALTDGRFIFQISQGGLSKLMLGSLDAPARVLGLEDGVSSLMAVQEERGDVLVAHGDAIRSRGLYRIHLDDGAQTLIFQPGKGGKFPAVAPVRVNLPIADGKSLPIDVWRAGPRPSRGVEIEFPINRAIIHHVTTTYNGGDQYVMRQGYDYIKFDYLPASDRSEGWEYRVTELDLLSALAVVNYARETLGAPADKVVLLGRSIGTGYVLRTAARMSPKVGGLVFEGVLSSLQTIDKIPDHHFRIAVFQGENDPFPPIAAKALIEDHFGASSLSGANGFWRVQKDEGHAFRLLRSKALVHAAIFQLLAAPK